MLVVYIIVSYISLCINLMLSAHFAELAGEKGYNKILLFWICVFFGMFMFLIIAMLPDRVQQERLERLEKILRES